MEMFWIVLRNIGIVVAIFYLVIVIVDVSFVLSFRSIMIGHDHDLFVIQANKKDMMEKLLEILRKHNVKCEKKQIDILTTFDVKRFEHQNGEEAKKAREELTSLCEYFLGLCRENNKVSQDQEFMAIESNLMENERVFRHHVTMYNADVLGYNFWIQFMPTRYIYLILRVKAKNLI